MWLDLSDQINCRGGSNHLYLVQMAARKRFAAFELPEGCDTVQSVTAIKKDQFNFLGSDNVLYSVVMPNMQLSLEKKIDERVNTVLQIFSGSHSSILLS